MQAETFDSDDLDEVTAFVSRAYSPMRLEAFGPPASVRIARRVLGTQLAFDDIDVGFDLGYTAEASEFLIIADVLTNTIRLDGGSATGGTFAPGDQFLLSRLHAPYSGRAFSPRLRFTLLDAELLNRVAATTGDGAGTKPVRLFGHRPLSNMSQHYLQRCIAYVRENVRPVMDTPPAPLLVATASQYLAASVLATYANSVIADGIREQQRDAAPSNTLARATAFIEANPDVDLTVVDVARAAHVTPRALQLAFRKHLGTTPMAYLRGVRLDHARADLRAAASGDGQTVTAIAARWGFTSARFTQQYRAAYGETPSNTLRN